jgi:hypothetical protein
VLAQSVGILKAAQAAAAAAANTSTQTLQGLPALVTNATGSVSSPLLPSVVSPRGLSSINTSTMSLAPTTTYVVVGGQSPRHPSSRDAYVAAVVQDVQGKSQHITVPASAICTGGPSVVLAASTGVPVTTTAQQQVMQSTLIGTQTAPLTGSVAGNLAVISGFTAGTAFPNMGLSSMPNLTAQGGLTSFANSSQTANAGVPSIRFVPHLQQVLKQQ